MGSTVLAHKQQLGVKSKTTVKPKSAEQRTKNKECVTKVGHGKDQKTATPLSQRRLVLWWPSQVKMAKRLLCVCEGGETHIKWNNTQGSNAHL